MITRDIMSRNPVMIHPEATVRDAATQMSEHNIGVLPIHDGDKLVGIVTDRDLAIRGLALGYDSAATPVKTVMTNNCVTCSEGTDVGEAVKLMEKKSVRRLIVTEPSGKPIGIFSLEDIARKGNDAKFSGKAFVQLHRLNKRTS